MCKSLLLVFSMLIFGPANGQNLFKELIYGMEKKEVKKILKQYEKSMSIEINGKYYYTNIDNMSFDKSKRLVSLYFEDTGEKNYADYQENFDETIQYFKDLGYQRFFERLHPTIVYDFQEGSFDMYNPDKTLMLEMFGTRFRITSIYYGTRIIVRRYSDYMENYERQKKEVLDKKDPFDSN